MFCSALIRRTLSLSSIKNSFKVTETRVFSTTASHIDQKTDVPNAESSQTIPVKHSVPIITSREVQFPSLYLPTKQAWLDTMSTLEEQKLGIIDLHPKIFGAYPRIDILHVNVNWQRKYRFIDYSRTRSRAEMPGGGRKPWAQKGSGRARHGSIRSPIFDGGAKALGPKGPKSFFYMLPRLTRVHGLCCALSVKYAQNDLYIVDSLDIPSKDPQYLEDLIDTRFWGFSVLFVDDTDEMPTNFALALSKIPHFNAMPVYGLNVYSMLKHETLVLTLAAVEKIEKKLLQHLHDPKDRETPFKIND